MPSGMEHPQSFYFPQAGSVCPDRDNLQDEHFKNLSNRIMEWLDLEETLKDRLDPIHWPKEG